MDVHDQLNQLAATVRGAKAMPMSTSCLVNRAEMLHSIKGLRDALPANLNQVHGMVSDRDAFVVAGREQAARILEGARTEREQLIEQADILVAARARAAELSMETRADSARLRADADNYVDRKLAELEVLLRQLGSQVSNGRQRLVARGQGDPAVARGVAQGTAPGLQSEEDARHIALPDHTATPDSLDTPGAGAADLSVGAR